MSVEKRCIHPTSHDDRDNLVRRPSTKDNSIRNCPTTTMSDFYAIRWGRSARRLYERFVEESLWNEGPYTKNHLKRGQTTGMYLVPKLIAASLDDTYR